MTERQFGELLATRLRAGITGDLQIETRRSVLYDLAFGDDGKLRLGLNQKGEPVRGGGTGFEQDVLIFRRVEGADTSIVPRVCIELKFGRVTTHDAIVYSEKADRIRRVYPFVRYGLVLGQHEKIPARVLRLGTEFDFIVSVAEEPTTTQEDDLISLLLEEIALSEEMGDILSGLKPVRSFRRKLEMQSD